MLRMIRIEIEYEYDFFLYFVKIVHFYSFFSDDGCHSYSSSSAPCSPV